MKAAPLKLQEMVPPAFTLATCIFLSWRGYGMEAVALGAGYIGAALMYVTWRVLQGSEDD